MKQRSGFRRGERRRLNEAVVWPFPQGACPAAILSLGPHSPAQVRWRKCIPTRAVRAGEWNWLCCSEVDAVAAQHNLNEIGELTGLWRVHHEALPFGVWHYLVSGGFLSGVDIMKLLCSSENGTLPPWSHHVGHPECPRASTGALLHIIFPYGLAFLIYLYVDFVLNWSLEYKGCLLFISPKKHGLNFQNQIPDIFQCQAQLQQNASVFMHGEFSAQKHVIVILDLYLQFMLVLLFKLCRYFPWVRNCSFRLWEE